MLLLDTHVFLWLASNDNRLSQRFLARIESERPQLLFSAASTWEMGIKEASGKLKLPQPYPEYVSTRMLDGNIEELPIRIRHSLVAAHLPMHHRDPFDRMLAAQSLTERLPLVSSDPIFIRYGVELIDPTR